MMDPSAIQIGAGAAGLVSASALIMILLQRVKDYWPAIQGRWAMLACDVVSLIVAVVVIYQTHPDWYEPLTYIALGLLTLSFGITARALFSQMFHVAVAGSPPSPDAAATVVIDPAPEGKTTTTVKKGA